LVPVAPTTNLDIQLLFGTSTLPTTVDSASANPSQVISYKYNTSGSSTPGYPTTGNVSNFGMYNDTTRGYVLQSQVTPATSGSPTYYGTYALLGSTVGSSNYHMPQTHTVMGWIYISSMPTGNAPHFVSCGGQSGFTHYIIFNISNNNSLIFYTNGTSFTINAPLAGFGGVWTGRWMHIARTFDSASKTMLCYVNGAVQNGSGTICANGNADTSNDVNIGGFIDGGNAVSNNNNCLFGLLDNIRIYSSVLSGATITSIYNYENSNPTA
jgi:hypothetical protein